jgi:hypothetical protein
MGLFSKIFKNKKNDIDLTELDAKLKESIDNKNETTKEQKQEQQKEIVTNNDKLDNKQNKTESKNQDNIQQEKQDITNPTILEKLITKHIKTESNKIKNGKNVLDHITNPNHLKPTKPIIEPQHNGTSILEKILKDKAKPIESIEQVKPILAKEYQKEQKEISKLKQQENKESNIETPKFKEIPKIIPKIKSEQTDIKSETKEINEGLNQVPIKQNNNFFKNLFSKHITNEKQETIITKNKTQEIQKQQNLNQTTNEIKEKEINISDLEEEKRKITSELDNLTSEIDKMIKEMESKIGKNELSTLKQEQLKKDSISPLNSKPKIITKKNNT